MATEKKIASKRKQSMTLCTRNAKEVGMVPLKGWRLMNQIKS